MSLNASPELLAKAREDAVDNADFVDCIRTSLPYGYTLVSQLSEKLHAGETVDNRPFVDNQVAPPSEEERGQLLRMMASDSMRTALQAHFGVRLAFQNCHRVAVFPVDPAANDALAIFTSPRAQLLNQSPALVSC